jgi:hypothetical protein
MEVPCADEKLDTPSVGGIKRTLLLGSEQMARSQGGVTVTVQEQQTQEVCSGVLTTASATPYKDSLQDNGNLVWPDEMRIMMASLVRKFVFPKIKMPPNNTSDPIWSHPSEHQSEPRSGAIFHCLQQHYKGDIPILFWKRLSVEIKTSLQSKRNSVMQSIRTVMTGM